MNKAVLLGPHPQNDNFSIVNYFNFCRTHLANTLPDWQVEAKWPGRQANAAIPVQNRKLLKVRWENFVLWPIQMSRINADIIHIVDQGLAWYGEFLPAKPKLVTVHDLISYLTWKGVLPFGNTSNRKKLHLLACARQIRGATHVISDSSTTAGHLMSMLQVPSSKITVIPLPMELSFSPLSVQERLHARALWFSNVEHVVIHVGKASTYKNRIGAIRAFDKLHHRLPSAHMFLVHGTPNIEESNFLRECRCRAAVHFLPPLTREQLREFYGAADVLIFPSLYEGFGWPPLEAMACGCPVVCSTRGSLKEVVVDAALTLDNPYDYDGLSSLTAKVLRDPDTALDLRTRGLRRSLDFCPSKILPRMADLYKQIISN